MWAGWVHHSWRFGHVEALHEVGSKMPECRSKTSTVPVVWENFGIFLARSKWFPVVIADHGQNLVISLWPEDKATISGGIAAHPAPKNSDCKNPLEKFSPQFFVIKTASSSLIIFQRAKLSTQSITYLCWCSWRTFWRKNAAGRSQGGLVLAQQCPGSPGTSNPEETGLPGLPVSWSPTLFSGSGPVGLSPVPWTEKTIERLPFFFQHGGHFCCEDLAGRTTFEFFFWVAYRS